MIRNTKWLGVLPLALVALVAAACAEQGGKLLEPDQAQEIWSSSSTGGGWSLLEGNVGTFSHSATIGPEGGSLGPASARLVVPKGAVTGPTLFTFASASDTHIQVKATATAVGSENPNDVGSAGFRVPVEIKLKYDSNSGGMTKWLKLVLVWVRPDGVLESVPSTVDPVRKVVTGKVNHFSDYGIGVPRDGGT